MQAGARIRGASDSEVLSGLLYPLGAAPDLIGHMKVRGL